MSSVPQIGSMGPDVKPVTAHRKKAGRRAPDPRPGCFLCQIEHTDRDLIELFHCWTEPTPRRRRQRIAEVCKTLGGPLLSVDDVERHFASHMGPQPAPSLGWLKRNIPDVSGFLKPRDIEIIAFLARARMATPEQIAAIFWPDSEPKTAGQLARRRLRQLAYRHVLYRVWVTGELAYRELYLLGRAGAELLTIHGDEAARFWAASPDDVARTRIPHDVELVNLALDLGATSTVKIGSSAIATVAVPQENIWAAQHLVMGLGKEGLYSRIKRDAVEPDGLVVVDVALDREVPGAPREFSVPLFIEWDTGNKKIPDVARQLAGYATLAAAGTVGKRFPRLAAEGYSPPVLMVTKSPITDSREAGIRRAEKLGREALALLKQDGAHRRIHPTILIAPRADIAASGLGARAFDVIREKPVPILSTIASASKPLIDAATVTGTASLEIRPKDGLPQKKNLRPRQRPRHPHEFDRRERSQR